MTFKRVAEVLKIVGLHFLTKKKQVFLYMLTRREVEPDRLPNDRVKILKEKMMRKDMDSLSNPNTGQELKLIEFTPIPIPQYIRF